MKTMAFASRNAKEILRDKTTLGFGIGFPVILLLLLSLIGANAPVDLFDVDKLTPGIAVFGMSFKLLYDAAFCLTYGCWRFYCGIYAAADPHGSGADTDLFCDGTVPGTFCQLEYTADSGGFHTSSAVVYRYWPALRQRVQ